MDRSKIKRRLAKDKLMLWGICLLAALTAVPLLAILGEVLLRGYHQLSWAFFTEPTPTAYKAMKAIEAGEPIPGEQHRKQLDLLQDNQKLRYLFHLLQFDEHVLKLK